MYDLRKLIHISQSLPLVFDWQLVTSASVRVCLYYLCKLCGRKFNLVADVL